MVEGIKGGHTEKPLPAFPVSTFCFSYSHLNPRSSPNIKDADYSLRESHDWGGHDLGHMPPY
jgi:hypothetical protein